MCCGAIGFCQARAKFSEAQIGDVSQDLRNFYKISPNMNEETVRSLMGETPIFIYESKELRMARCKTVREQEWVPNRPSSFFYEGLVADKQAYVVQS